MVAIGDAYLAGVLHGALYESGQQFSVPALMARQAGAAGFTQPLVADPGFALGEADGGRLALVSAFPPVVERLPRGGPPLLAGLDRPYNNLAVPGALVLEALSVRSSATSITDNPFYDLVLRDEGTFAEQARAMDATLALVWLGTTDVLAFAATGGNDSLAPGPPPPPATVGSIMEALLDQLLEVTGTIALFTVPDVTRFPFFTTVPPHVIDPLTGEPRLVTIFEEVIDPVTGDTLTVQRQVPIPLLGPEGPLNPRDLVTLEAHPLLGAGVGIPSSQGGTGAPLPDRVVLDVGEQLLVRDVVVGYNAALAQLAQERRLALVDVHALVEAIATEGVVSDGVLLAGDYVTGQAFGLDGTTFTAKGYGVVANLLIDALNARYGSRLPFVRTASLPGVPLLEPDL